MNSTPSASPDRDTVRGGDLDAFFAPASIAVIGASADTRRSGGRVLATLEQTGFKGAIHPVSRSQTEIGGRPCHATLADIEGPVDLALICVAAEHVPAAIDDCAARGVRGAIVFADGFSEPALGAGLREAIERAKARCGLRVIGPNTVGNRVVNTGVYTTIATDIGMPHLPGNIATIGQSGGLTIYFGSAYLAHKGIGSKYIIDTGGEFDVDAAECLEQVAADPDIACAALILEGCRDGRRLMRAVERMASLGKPVVFWKTGRSQASAAQIASHTGSLAGQAQIFEEGMRRAGAIVVQDETEFVDALALASAGAIPKGRRLGVVTPSGGYAIITLDAAERFGLEIPAVTLAPTDAQKAAIGPAHYGNPLDVYALFGAGRKSFEAAVSWMAAQPHIDAVLIWQSYGNMHAQIREIVLGALTDIVASTDKAIFCCGMATPEFERKLRDIGVTWFEEPTRLVRAIGLVAPKAPARVAVPRHAATGGRTTISGEEARDILAAVPELPHVRSYAVESADEAEAIRHGLDRPIFLKLESERLAHKTEAGAVAGPLGADAVAGAFARLAKLKDGMGDPTAAIYAQASEHGVELAMGGFIDSSFGPSVMVGMGGIYVEVMKDAAFAVAPVTAEQARGMILSLRAAPLLMGARGKPPADIDAAAEALAAFSRFVAANADRYSEIDVNPVMVRARGHGVVAVDALVVRAGQSQGTVHD
jgi:acyl-CoA synthetase (NDP forming)